MKIIYTKAFIYVCPLLLLTSYFSLIHAQVPDTLWTRTYGGAEWDWSYFIKQTTDYGYILVGTTHSFGGGGGDVWLPKTAPDTFGIKEQEITPKKNSYLGSTIFSGPLILPKDKTCKVVDITGRVVIPDKIKSGIYFIEVDGEIRQKVVKVR